MQFETFNFHHIETAARLALAEYLQERQNVTILPDGDYQELFCEMLTKMVDHQLGVVAIDAGEMVGFLTCYEPRNNYFGKVMGNFSPIHAHGTVPGQRKRIYSLLYQNAAAQWVKEGILSHVVALYAHDQAALTSFYWNGFGLRCVDAIRPVAPVAGVIPSLSQFAELPAEALATIVPLKQALKGHLRNSPMFMPVRTEELEQILAEQAERQARFFVARDREQVIGFIEVAASGENFATEAPDMVNICGAYLLPEYRGSGIYTALLAWLMERLTVEGVIRCGVDFESFNPTASGFWLKHFTAYTYSVARRIDERIYAESESNGN